MKKTIPTGKIKPKTSKPSKKMTNLSYEKLDPKLAKKTGRTKENLGC
jgi:hypothetical protein